MQPGSWLVHVLELLMEQDNDFLKYDMEFLYAEQYLSTRLIKMGARKWGLKKLGLKLEEIPKYQERIIKLFESVPWFMSSQVKNSSFHSDYDHLYMEEKAF